MLERPYLKKRKEEKKKKHKVSDSSNIARGGHLDGKEGGNPQEAPGRGPSHGESGRETRWAFCEIHDARCANGRG